MNFVWEGSFILPVIHDSLNQMNPFYIQVRIRNTDQVVPNDGVYFCETPNCTRYMLCPENIPVVQARDCGAHELDDGRPQHGGTVRSRHAHIVAKDNSTVRYPANVYALTVK
jgi:hypothetical protein